MENQFYTYEQLCQTYGTETIEKLDSFIYWQIQQKGNVNVQNQIVSVDDYFKFYNKS